MKPRCFSRDSLHSTTAVRLELVTVTADSGVGSSSTLTELALLYPSYRPISGGAIMRQWAAAHEMSIEDWTTHIDQNPQLEIDIKLDAQLMLDCESPRVIIESRLAHMLGKHGFHVLLTCPYTTRAQRRAKDKLKKEIQPPGVTFESLKADVQKALELRDRQDWQRFEGLYPDCRWPQTDFDLHINTGDFLPEEIGRKILKAHQVWQEQQLVTLQPR